MNYLNRYKKLTLKVMNSWVYSGAELADLVATGLLHDSAFGVLILGEPGSGKTTVALQMAAQLEELGWETPAVIDDPYYYRYREGNDFGVLCSRQLASACRCLRMPFIICRDVSRESIRHPVLDREMDRTLVHFSSEIYFVDFAWMIRRGDSQTGTVEIKQLKDRYRSTLTPPFTTRLKQQWRYQSIDNNQYLKKGRKILRQLR